MKKIVAYVCLLLGTVSMMKASNDISIIDEYRQIRSNVKSVINTFNFKDKKNINSSITKKFLITISHTNYNYSVMYQRCVCCLKVSCIENDRERVILKSNDDNLEVIAQAIAADIQTQELVKSGYFQ